MHDKEMCAVSTLSSWLLFVSVLNRNPVEELLERLFSSCDAVTGAHRLRQLCLNESVNFKLMHSRLQFVAGDCGGVKVVVTDDNGLAMRLP